MQCWIVVLRVLGVVVDEVLLDLRVLLDKVPLDLQVVLDKVLLDLDLWVLQDKVHHHFHLKVEALNMRHAKFLSHTCYIHFRLQMALMSTCRCM